MSKPARGYMLLEALIALLVLAVGLFAGLRLASVSISSSAEAKARAFAQYYAQDKLESLRTLIARGEYHSGSCPAGLGAGSLLASSSSADTITMQGAVFSRSWQLAPYCDPQRQALKVWVTWQDKTGTHRIELESMQAWSDPARSRER
ncbi:type IV pilus modification PilV family protein [Craterilacuibacter sp.]|uniref:type IV pilus modification PilV family protein n=1 Tax=Craterilacuibacter sp. TaxID=2870909 RepID=UPI003F3DE415